MSKVLGGLALLLLVLWGLAWTALKIASGLVHLLLVLAVVLALFALVRRFRPRP